MILDQADFIKSPSPYHDPTTDDYYACEFELTD